MPAAKTAEQMLKDHTLELPDGCIIWTGSRDKDGYGKCNRRDPIHGRISLPHRMAFLLKHGSIPQDCEIDHKCYNRCCVNPYHLQAIPHAQNVMLGRRSKERHRNGKKTHCKRGHLLSGDNVRIEMWRNLVMRKCKICIKIRKQETEN